MTQLQLELVKLANRLEQIQRNLTTLTQVVPPCYHSTYCETLTDLSDVKTDLLNLVLTYETIHSH